ncbi:hypothetical protein [uncultured Roseobacter sp.]|uniref:hypothetical protein n=1 Tax=uncultured Roseobacter sp. TaxID=114847 RepID=UPI0026297E32|nr:hypothetical protein [uncultured Roseobacter sp.]
MTTDQPQKQTDRSEVSRAAQSAKTHIKDQVGELAEGAKAEASRRADAAKETAASEVGDVASALRRAADEFRDGSPQERTFSQLADGIADVSDTIRGKDLGEMVRDVSDFARRNPAPFLAGAALMGFAAVRFTRASQAEQAQSAGYTPATLSGRQPSTSH